MDLARRFNAGWDQRNIRVASRRLKTIVRISESQSSRRDANKPTTCFPALKRRAKLMTTLHVEGADQSFPKPVLLTR